MTPTMQAITRYGELLKAAVQYEMSEWYFSNGDSETKHYLWIAKTKTHYVFKDCQSLMACLRLKTLLLWDTSAVRARLRVGIEG